MKTHTGFMELVMIMVFVIACVPLLISLIAACNSSKFNYLDDKTIYKMADTVEYIPGTNLPVNLAPIQLDYGGCQLIAVIQDDYCPESGKLVNWKLTANTPSGELKTVSGDVVTYTPVSHLTLPGYGPSNTLAVTKGWYTKRANAFAALHNIVSPAMRSEAADPYYLVWDYTADCWMITHEFVNIFEEK